MPWYVKARRYWDVKCPPRKKHMIGGKLLPSVRGVIPFPRRRRVVLEIYGVCPEDDNQTKNIGGTGRPLATAVPRTMAHSSLDMPLEHEDFVRFKILKQKRRRSLWKFSHDGNQTNNNRNNKLDHENTDEDDEDDDDEEEEDGLSDSVDSDQDGESSRRSLDEEEWIEYRNFGLDDIDETKEMIDHKSLEYHATVGRGRSLEVRDIRFSSRLELEDFHKNLQLLRNSVKQLAKQVQAKFEKQTHLTKSSLSLQEDICLLVEIVSATDLPPKYGNDPYIEVWMGRRPVHKTNHISDTLDPIWTVHTGSFFLLKVTSQFFFSATGLTFVIRDKDTVGYCEVMGKLTLRHKTLLEAQGERVAYDLEVPPNSFDLDDRLRQPKLNIRIRKASQEDKTFMETLDSIPKKRRIGVYRDLAYLAPTTPSIGKLIREAMPTFNGKLHRVKPFPDPDRDEAETKFMTGPDIQQEYLKPSTKWIETGSGLLGRVYLEILCCDGLPNKDEIAPGISLGDSTDAFCSVVYEDSIVNTDVIDNELSPRWMPWTQRAFLFRIDNLSSQILLGVFDYDLVTYNDAIGRIAVDITNFSDGIDYVLTYQLYDSVIREQRKPQGTITIRLRLEIDHPRAAFVASVLPPPAEYVNMPRKSDCYVARTVTQGDENPYRLNTDILESYKQELLGYQYILHDVLDAFMTVALWRGHYEVEICCRKLKLPLYSFVVFIMGIVVVEDYDLFPSVILFSLGLVFLATNQHRQRHPSPWHQTHTVGGLWCILLTGKMPKKEFDLQTTDSELRPLIDEYDWSIRERKENYVARGETERKANEYFEREKQAVVQATEIERMETKLRVVEAWNPLNPFLFPVQKHLGLACKYLRIARSIVMWEDSYATFVIANACFLTGLLFAYVPWGWIVHMGLRLVVWSLLGPWMKIVDILVVRKLEDAYANNAERLEEEMEKRSRLLRLHKHMAMMRRETAIKLLAMKKYMFGKYIVEVPRFKQFRFRDVPLPQSTATRHVPGNSSIRISARKHGQRLVGDMIPKWGDDHDRAMLTEIENKRREIISGLHHLNPFAHSHSLKGTESRDEKENTANIV